MSGPEGMEGLCKLFREFKAQVIKTRGLEEEINELIRKAGLLKLDPIRAFLQEALTGTPDLDFPISFHHKDPPVHSPLAFLRAAGKAEEHLQEAMGVARELKVPSPPPLEFSKPLDVEAELLRLSGAQRVRFKEVRILVRPDTEDPSVSIWCAGAGGSGWMRPEEVWVFLPQIGREFRELLEEALGKFKKYFQELEQLKARVTQQHHKEILMGEL
jgi:hypothetical protein